MSYLRGLQANLRGQILYTLKLSLKLQVWKVWKLIFTSWKLERKAERIDKPMKSVKDVSLELKVSTTTIYNHINKLGKAIKPYVFKVKNITYLNDEGIRQIKISMGLLEVPTVQETISIENIIDEISLNVREDIRKDFIDLKETIKNNNSNLEKELEEIREQNKLLIEMLQEKKSKSFIDKLKGLFKSNDL